MLVIVKYIIIVQFIVLLKHTGNCLSRLRIRLDISYELIGEVY